MFVASATGRVRETTTNTMLGHSGGGVTKKSARPVATRRADGGCGRSLRWSSSKMAKHRLPPPALISPHKSANIAVFMCQGTSIKVVESVGGPGGPYRDTSKDGYRVRVLSILSPLVDRIGICGGGPIRERSFFSPQEELSPTPKALFACSPGLQCEFLPSSQISPLPTATRS